MSKRTKGPSADPEGDAAMGSDQPGNAPTALAVRGSSALIEPIVVPNTLWQ